MESLSKQINPSPIQKGVLSLPNNFFYVYGMTCKKKERKRKAKKLAA
jgi:hypothetical protein